MRWSKRHRHTFDDKAPKPASKFLEEHRIPPKPKHYYDRKPGRCRFCGHVVKTDQGQPNKRARWHSDCVDQYNIMYHPNDARKAVWQRDNGRCVQCDVNMPKTSRKPQQRWHVDHIRPLWEQKGKKFKDLDLSYWELTNLQTLCAKCHGKKSAKEAGIRAKKSK